MSRLNVGVVTEYTSPCGSYCYASEILLDEQLPVMNVIACYPRELGQVNEDVEYAIELAKQQGFGRVIVTYAMASRAATLEDLFAIKGYTKQEMAKMWLHAIAAKSDIVVHAWAKRGGMWLKDRIDGLIEVGAGKSYCTAMTSNPIPHALPLKMSMWTGNKSCLVKYPPHTT